LEGKITISYSGSILLENAFVFVVFLLGLLDAPDSFAGTTKVSPVAALDITIDHYVAL
jgi:hypothetical protein